MFDLWFEEVLLGGVFLLEYVEKFLIRVGLMFYVWLVIFSFCFVFLEYNYIGELSGVENSISNIMGFFSGGILGGWGSLN